MSHRLIVPPVGERCCYRCVAWQNWDTQAVCDRSGTVIGRQPTGQCRAAPPSIDPDAIGGSNAAWPVVNGADWCLRFAASDVPANAEGSR